MKKIFESVLNDCGSEPTKGLQQRRSSVSTGDVKGNALA